MAARAGVVELAPPPRPPEPRTPTPAPPVGKRHEVLGLLTSSAALLLALALASYDSRGGTNWCGPLGAGVAEALLALLGTASAVLPLGMMALAVRLFRRTERPLQPLRTVGTAAIIATVATALHLFLGERPLLGHLAAGGLLGVTVGELLRGFLGTAGAHLVVLTALLLALVVRTRLSLVSLASRAADASERTSAQARRGLKAVLRRDAPAPSPEPAASHAAASAPATSSALAVASAHDSALEALVASAEEPEESPAELPPPAPPRAVALPAPTPTPEARTVAALTPVLAAAEKRRLAEELEEEEPEEEPTHALDSQPEETRAALAALMDMPVLAPTVLRRESAVPAPDAQELDSALTTQPEGSAHAEPEARRPRVLPPSLRRRPRRPESAPEAPASPVPARTAEEPLAPAPTAERSSPAVLQVAEVGAAVVLSVPAAEPAAPLVFAAPATEVPQPAPTAPVRRRPSRAVEPQEQPVPLVIVKAPPLEPAAPPPVVPVVASVRSAPAPAPTPPASSAPAPLAALPEEPAEEPGEVLQIVSHDEEIARAMQAPMGVLAAPHVEAPPERPMQMPSLDVLTAPPGGVVQVDEAQLHGSAERLVKTLKDYGIDGRVVEVHPGPVVTTFELVPAAGTKLARIARLSDDMAMSLEAQRVRIVAPIPGKGRVGFEIPNVKRQTVFLRELLETEAFRSLGGALPVALGKDVVGAPYFADLATMPHVIVAGSTGSGKSVGLNVMLASLLFKRGPEDVRLLMIDPKMVELAVYDGIPHMLLPVVTDMKKAALALRWVVDEMERRYTLFAQTGARNITTFNERVARALSEGVPLKGMPRTPEGEEQTPQRLPYILCVVDEFADLMMVAGKDVEAAVARLAQKARAAGIHVILATQRPSVDVITGVIKANFPSRIAFKVSSRIDSRTILDQQGAEQLLGRGDMLVLPPGSSDLRRVHSAFVSEDEVQAVTDHWRAQGTPTYDDAILRPREDEAEEEQAPELKVPQEKYEKAVALVLSSRKCSVSWVQRQLAIGYNVAARIVEKMEREGIVSAPKGPGKEREVLG